jgi:hypothetical protein
MTAKNIRKPIISLFLAIGLSSGAVTLNEAKDMYLGGDFAGALPGFEEALQSKPKDPSLNQWVGVCLLRTGRQTEAVPYLEFADSKGITDAPRYLAEIEFYKYHFDKASNYIDKYEKGLKKVKKSMPEDVEQLKSQIERGKTMLDRVEKIVVIDSIAVNRENFFKAYRLSPEAGSIQSVSVLPAKFSVADHTTVYMPETKSSMMWAAPDSMLNYVLMSSTQLYDNTWEKPAPLKGELEMGGDSNYPFMMPDGVTLYYANNGEESLGGYDIFISRKDEDGFLQPQNIGMPYNSPYDDYLLAIDEITGVGWWATDRNHLGDDITIYIFIPADLRINYPVTLPDLAEKARLASYKATWEEGQDYTTLLNSIKNIDTESKAKSADFRFAMPGNKVYTSWDDFKNPRARKQMSNYVDAQEALANSEATLAAMRLKYRNGETSLKSSILQLENKVENDRDNLKKIANEVINYEQQ